MPLPCSQDEKPTPWLKYNRKADNKKVEARLVWVTNQQGQKNRMLEVRGSRAVDLCCPSCRELISQGNGHQFPNLMLEPKVFHEKFRPVIDK